MKDLLPRAKSNLSRLTSKFRLLSPVYFNKYLQYCRLYGVKNATQLALRKAWHANPALKIDFTPLSVPDFKLSVFDQTLPILDKQISIVIPTRNAGSNFPTLLGKLKAQKGVRAPEIIIVDSGSSDDTVGTARSAGVTVVEIPPESFNHAHARNKGAERATGEYILFTVQDALPLTDRWLWEMAQALEQNNIVAVSCAEYPRADRDLFYRVLIWNHYKSLDLDKDRIMAWNEACSSQIGLRSSGQISDLAALMRTDIFRAYKYKAEYAEDLDLGIRLIRDGYKIGFLYSTRVLHSHNRPPYYFLKRAYVDSRFLVEILPDFGFRAIDTPSRLLRSIASLYARTNDIANIITNLKSAQPIKHIMEQIRDLYTTDVSGMELGNAFTGDRELEEFIQDLLQETGTAFASYAPKDNLILPHILDHLRLLEAYATEVYEIVDDNFVGDLLAAVYKIFALHSGANLAYLYLTLSRLGTADRYLINLDKALKVGI